MGKKRKSQNYKKDNSNSPRPIAESQHCKMLPVFSVLWKWFVAFAIVFGVVQGLAAFAPRLSVYQSSALDVSNPFSNPFIISNDGMLDIHSIEYSCISNFIETESHIILKDVSAENWIPGRQILSPSEKDSFSCPLKNAMKQSLGLRVLPIKTADITLEISFRPSWAVWKQTKSFRFIAARTSDNQLQWLPKSLK